MTEPDGARASLTGLSAALATGDPALRDAALDEARARASPVAVEEAILQSHLFLGYPTALNALAAWRERTGFEASGDGEPPSANWAERGERVCRTVYGGQYGALRDNVRRLHPDMERWMVEDGYGRVLGRPGLALVERELCIVALLAVLDVPRQLYAHLRGALNAGATAEAVEGALARAARVSADGARRSAADTWAAVRARTAGRT